jgi:hypothetical protein
MIKKLLLSSVLAASAISSQAQAHSIALGWDLQTNGDVDFYLAHWHGELTSAAHYLTIDGTNYNFTGVENNVNSRSGLEGAIVNPSYYNWTPSTGTLSINSIPTSEGFGSDNDWLTVTVSGLTTGQHIFGASTNVVTSWTMGTSTSDLTFTLPPAPSAVPVPAAAALFAPALLGFMALRRKSKTNA